MKYLLVLFLVGCDQVPFVIQMESCAKACEVGGSRMAKISAKEGCVCSVVVIEARP